MRNFWIREIWMWILDLHRKIEKIFLRFIFLNVSSLTMLFFFLPHYHLIENWLRMYVPKLNVFGSNHVYIYYCTTLEINLFLCLNFLLCKTESLVDLFFKRCCEGKSLSKISGILYAIFVIFFHCYHYLYHYYS